MFDLFLLFFINLRNTIPFKLMSLIKYNLYSKILIIILVFFSCKADHSWKNIDQIDVVRTPRDSTYLFNSNPYSGTIKKINSSNIKILVFNTIKGKLNGVFTEYYLNGNKKIERNYKNGTLNGKYTSYFKNSQEKENYNYDMGLINGERKSYWINGAIKQSSFFKSGVLFGESNFYYSSSQLRKKISFDLYGNRDGVWLEYYSNGKIKEKIEYESGIITVPIIKYDINGEIIK